MRSDRLNKLGSEGWELLGEIDNAFIFKRQTKDAVKRKVCPCNNCVMTFDCDAKCPEYYFWMEYRRKDGKKETNNP